MERSLRFALVLALALPSTSIVIGCGHKGNGDADTNIDGGTSSGVDTGTGSGMDTGTGSGMDTGTGGGDDTGTGSGTDTGTGSGSDTGTGSGTDANVDGGPGSPGSLGSPCTGDASCTSGRCAAITLGAGMVCVTPCSSHLDCIDATSYCAPTPGGGGGVCAPPSSSLCVACTTDAECGVVSEVCARGPGDSVNSCHYDCSLDPLACTGGYTCQTVTVGSTTRHICAPPTTCAAALGCGSGGTCGTNQSCCSGTCQPIDTAASCGACGVHCGTGEGCCGLSCRLLNTVMNCTACGNVCLSGAGTSDASCSATGCQLTCRGENWDVNGNPADGCEDSDTVPPGHTTSTASSRGSFTGFDSMSMDSFSGRILSDTRIHLPPVSGMMISSGSAPDYWTVSAQGCPTTDTGVVCTDDLHATITTTGGSSSGTCYRLTITGGTSTYMVDVSGAGSATINQAAPAYSNGATLTFEVSKTCSSATHEDVSYTVSYHL